MFIQVYVDGKMVDRFMVRNPRVAVGSEWQSCGRVWKVKAITMVTPMTICVEAENA